MPEGRCLSTFIHMVHFLSRVVLLILHEYIGSGFAFIAKRLANVVDCAEALICVDHAFLLLRCDPVVELIVVHDSID